MSEDQVFETLKYRIEVDEYGAKRYYNSKDQLHRENGPAVEYPNGDKLWYINDELHREDGPAVEWANGDKLWYINGELHREDGPACEYSDGGKYWYINGDEITETEFNQWRANNAK